MFQHPWAILLGGLAVGLPVFVHWLTRPRPVRFPVSTLRFLREALHQRRARHRLRDIVILTLRTLAIALLALAIARPLTEAQIQKPVESENAERIRVVIIDTSQSMASRDGSIALFERGRSLAAEELKYQSRLKANLILAGARPQFVFDGTSTNFNALNEELSKARPLPEELDVQTALNLAAEMLSGGTDSPRTKLELVVVSDFQRTNWAQADFSVLPQATQIKLQAVAGDASLPNLAILNVTAQGRAEAGRELRVEVIVGNYSETPRRVRIELKLGEDVHVLEGSCPPESRTALTTDILPRATGWQLGEARLVGVEDSLPDDNARPFALQVRAPPQYVLITRQPATKRPSSSYFLERALLPTVEASGNDTSRLARLLPDDLAPEELGQADLIVVDHPGRMPQESINQLAALVRRGRGMLYVAAEAIDATNLKLLEESIGSGFEFPVEFLPPEQHQARTDLLLSEPRAERPPFSIFEDNLKSAIAPLRFSGGVSTRTKPDALEDSILASYSDGSACLIVTQSGSGSLAVLNVDLEHSNLYQSPMFVPLLGELAQHYLLYRTQGADEVSCGESFVVELPSETGAIEGLSLRGPDSRTTGLGGLHQETRGILWQADRLEAPGVYRVVRDQQTEFAIVAAIPATESDLRTLPKDVFQDRLAGGRSLEFRSSGFGEREETDWLWTWLAIACVGCLLGEILSLKFFRT